MKSFFLNIPYQKKYCITSNENIAATFEAYFGSCFSYSGDDDCILYSIETIDDSRYSIRSEGDDIVVESPISYFSRLISHNFSKAKSTFALHAAAIVYNDKAYVLVAPSGMGKTTLTAYLNEKGLDYINDDCTIINMSDLTVYPYTLPLHIREESMKILSEHNVNTSNYIFVNDGYIHRYIKTNTKQMENSIPIEAIFFIFRKEKDNQIRNTPSEMVLTMLMKSPVCTYSFGKEFWEKLFKISNSIKTFTILYSDMDFVYKIIKGSDQIKITGD